MALKAGRHTGAKEYEQARRSGVFAAAPAGLAIGTPPHAGVGKAAVFSNRANRTDDMVALGMVIALDKIAYKKAPISETASRNQPESADKKPAILPQSLQSAADVAPGKHEAETTAAIAGTIKARGTARLDELVEAVMDARAHPERANKYGVIMLFDDYAMRKGRSGEWYLEHVKLVNGIIVSEFVADFAPELTEEGRIEIVSARRGTLHDFMVKVHNAPSISATERSARVSLKNMTESVAALDAVRAKQAVAV